MMIYTTAPSSHLNYFSKFNDATSGQTDMCGSRERFDFTQRLGLHDIILYEIIYAYKRSA